MKIAAQLLTWVIQAYQILLSPLLGQRCRYYPSCSHYAVEAINKHGVTLGSYYSAKRLLRCHPWHAGGHDPVP